MERNREWTSFFTSQHQYSTCSLASTTFELRSSDDFILEGRAESERLLSAQIMIFYHSVFKTLTNSFLNITTFLFFSFLLSSCTFHMRSIFEFFKRRVSKQKRRFTEGGFDLDLTCILSMCGLTRIYGILPSFLSYDLIWPKVSTGCMQRTWRFVREVTETVPST